MDMLSRAVCAAKPLPIRILQIGDGVFLRGFFDWMVDVANEKLGLDLGVAVVLARSHRDPPKLAAHDGLFTVFERGRIAGEIVERRRIVSAVQTAFDPHRDAQTLRRLAEAAELEFVVSNTTEAGIVDVDEPYDPQVCPQSFPAKAAWVLKARHDALGPNGAGLIFLPCELIEANGATLKRIVGRHFERWGFEQPFLDWVASRCVFLDTLVDRIVPGFPSAEAEVLFAEWGYRDPLAVVVEPFHLLVIEGPAELSERLPLARAGLDVIWTDRLKPYRDAKVRMLNGAHTAMALPAFLAGLDTVGEAIGDPLFARYLDRLMFDVIAPHVVLPDGDPAHYGRSVLERFSNPFLRHELIAIALNSVSKWKARLLPTLRDVAASSGEAPDLIAFAFAALVHFYRGHAIEGGYEGERARGPYPLRDDAAVLARFADAWTESGSHDAGAVGSQLMRDKTLWGESLADIGNFETLVRAAAEDIATGGIRTALERRL